MKTIMIPPIGIARIKELSNIKALNAHFGGSVESVTSPRLPYPFCMIADEEGRMKGLLRNNFASWLYGVDNHGEIIVGDVFLMKSVRSSDGYNLVGLTEQEIHHLAGRFQLELASVTDDA